MHNVSKLQDFALLLQGTYNQLEQKYSEQHIVEQIHFHGITQLVNQTNILPQSLAAGLSENIKMSIAVELMKKNELDDLFQAFNDSNLHNILLFKGSALAHSLYNNSWLRPRTDNDILIHKAEFNKYKAVLEQLGYQKLVSIDGHYVSYQCTYVKALSRNVKHTIDVHWKINNRQLLANCFKLNELLSCSSSLNNFSANILIPDHISSLLIAAVHRIGHHAHEERLIWLYDMHLLCETLDHDNWQILINTAQKKGIINITYEALTVCKKLLASNIPDDVLKQMEQMLVEPEASTFFLKRDLPEWKYFLHDLKGLNTNMEKLKLIKEHLLPSREYMLARMGQKNLLSAYFKRLINGSKRIFKL